MAYRISSTTPADTELLAAIREKAWSERLDVSEVIRQAFQLRLEDTVQQVKHVEQSKANDWFQPPSFKCQCVDVTQKLPVGRDQQGEILKCTTCDGGARKSSS